MTSRMNLPQLGQMVRNPELPFSLDAIERAMLAGLNEFFVDPSSKILAVRQAFGSIRELGQDVHDGVVRTMEEALGIGSDEISVEQAARMHEEAVLPCARVSREEAERQLTVALFEKMRTIYEPRPEGPGAPGM